MDRSREILTATNVALGFDPDSATSGQLPALIANAALLSNWIEGHRQALARAANRFAAEGTSSDATEAMSEKFGRREAKQNADRARTADAIKPLGDAMAKGTIGGAHLDAAQNAQRGLTDQERREFERHGAELAQAAEQRSPDEFARIARDKAREVQARHGADRAERQRRQRRISRRTDSVTGMHHTDLILDDESDQRLWQAIRHLLDSACQGRRDDSDDRDWNQFSVDALIDFLASNVGNPGRPTALADVTVIIDHATLRNGPHEGTVCEYADATPAPVDTIRRLSCDATLRWALLNAHGAVLNLSRTARVASASQRAALQAMYATCAHPGCVAAFDRCRIHHIDWWERGGTTDLANLIPLCEHHHHLVHEGGWHLRLIDPGTTRTLEWYRPDGALHVITTPNRRRTADPGASPPGRPPDEPATLFDPAA